MKLAHSGGSPGNFFVRKDETTDRGAYQKKRDGADNRISEECTTPSFEDSRRVLSMNKNLKLPQSGGSPGVFPGRHDKNISHGGFQTRNTVEDKIISEAVATTSFGGGRGVLPMNKNLKQPHDKYCCRVWQKNTPGLPPVWGSFNFLFMDRTPLPSSKLGVVHSSDIRLSVPSLFFVKAPISVVLSLLTKKLPGLPPLWASFNFFLVRGTSDFP